VRRLVTYVADGSQPAAAYLPLITDIPLGDAHRFEILRQHDIECILWEVRTGGRERISAWIMIPGIPGIAEAARIAGLQVDFVHEGRIRRQPLRRVQHPGVVHQGRANAQGLFAIAIRIPRQTQTGREHVQFVVAGKGCIDAGVAVI